MSALPQLLGLLRRFEGLHRLGKDGLVYPYLCPAGIPTQGYGVVVKSLDIAPITPAAAEAGLAVKANEHMAQAIKLSPTLGAEDGPRLAAIASFIYNLGSGRYRSSTLRKRVNAGDWAGAAKEMEKWVWGGGKKLPGLVIRRAVEAQLLLGVHENAPSERGV